MSVPSIYDVLQAHIPHLPPVFHSQSLHAITADGNPETESHIATCFEPQAPTAPASTEYATGFNSEPEIRNSKQASESASTDLSFPGTDTAICSEISPGSGALPPEHETRNSELQLAADSAADSASTNTRHVGEDTTICSEITPGSDERNPEHETRKSEPPGHHPRRWHRYARQLARPVPLTQEIGDAILDAVAHTGISDARAGYLFNISSTTVSQWKLDDPTFAEYLESARADFTGTQLQKFCDTPARNGRHATRKSMWLLEYTNPERYGRRRKPAAATPESESANLSHVGKDTPICSEIRSAAAAATSELETQNSEQETAAISAADCASCDPSHLGKDTPICSETIAGSDAPNSKHGTRNQKPQRRRRRWRRRPNQPGRPTLLDENTADALYEAILRTGISDSRAATLLNISRPTIARWKQQDPAFAQFLEIARSKFQSAQLHQVRATPAKTPLQDARNAKWLLEYSDPVRLGRRPRKLPSGPSSPCCRRTLVTAPESESPGALYGGKDTPLCSEIPCASVAPNATAPAAARAIGSPGVSPGGAAVPAEPLHHSAFPPAPRSAAQSRECGAHFETASPSSPQSESPEALYVGNDTPICSEFAPHLPLVTLPASAATATELESRNPRFETVSPTAPRSESIAALYVGKVTPLCSETQAPSAGLTAPVSAATPNATTTSPHRLTRKQRRRQTHLARRAASKAARLARRSALLAAAAAAADPNSPVPAEF